MKIGSLISGIVLLIIAVVGFTSTSNTISEQQTTIGEVERYFSEDVSSSYQTSQYAQLGFGVLGVVGIGLLIYGVAAKGEKKEKGFYCKYCGHTSDTLEGIRVHIQYYHKKNSTDSKQEDLKNIGILKERLAKGEITKEEYDDLKKEFEK